MKRILAVAMVLLVLTGCANSSAPEVTTTGTTATGVPEETECSTVPTETIALPETKTVTDLYQDLVEDYRMVLEGQPLQALSATMQQVFSNDPDSKATLQCLVEELPLSAQQNGGYVLHDLNADGVPELFWVGADHSILAVFTRNDRHMVLLDGFFGRYRGYVSEYNGFYTHGSNGAADNRCIVYSLEDSQWKAQLRFGMEDGVPFEAAGKEQMEIPEERLLELSDQFPDGVGAYWKQREICSLDRKIQPDDTDGSKTQKITAESRQLPFLQKIRRIDQALHRGPGDDYSWLGNLGETGTYTILAVVSDQYGSLWGKLKSGDGWVNLTQLWREAEDMPRVTATYVDERLLKSGVYGHQVVSADEYVQQVAICAHQEIRDIEFYAIDVRESNVAEKLLFTMEKLKSGGFVLVDLSFPGDMTIYGMRFADENGEICDYLLTDSGYGGFGGYPMWEEAFMVDISDEIKGVDSK